MGLHVFISYPEGLLDTNTINFNNIKRYINNDVSILIFFMMGRSRC